VALTWPGLILPLAGAAGQPLLVVLLLLGSDPLHPARQRLLRSPLPKTPPGAPPSALPPQGCPKALAAAGSGGGDEEGVPVAPPKPTHCRFSWASDFFSARRWERMLFRMLAWNSATPLRGQGQREGDGGTPAWGTPPETPAPPGGLQGRGLEVQHDVQEVIAEEDAALEEEEEEADAVPDDARLLHGQRAVVVLAHLLGWQAEMQAGQAAAQTCAPPRQAHPSSGDSPQTPPPQGHSRS